MTIEHGNVTNKVSLFCIIKLPCLWDKISLWNLMKLYSLEYDYFTTAVEQYRLLTN